ncbi:MAG: hypothetical protein ACW98F_18900 [Candidatus Hodarchaeales archaeon]
MKAGKGKVVRWRKEAIILVSFICFSIIPQSGYATINEEGTEELEEGGIDTIDRIIVTKEGQCLIFYMASQKRPNSTRIARSYVRVLDLDLDGNSSYITPRFPVPRINLVRIGLIQEDNQNLRMKCWSNGTRYDIWYHKDEKTIEVQNKGKYFNTGTCTFCKPLYEWGIEEKTVIGKYTSAPEYPKWGHELVIEEDNTIRVELLRNTSSQTYFCFYQKNSTYGYYTYREGSITVVIDVQIRGTVNIIKTRRFNGGWAWIQQEEAIPYLVLLEDYYLTPNKSRLEIVNLLNSESIKLDIKMYPDWHAYPPTIFTDEKNITHVFVTYDDQTSWHVDPTRLEYVQYNQDGSVKQREEIDERVLESNRAGQASKPEYIQLYRPHLVAILGEVYFAVINITTGQMITVGKTHFNFYVPTKTINTNLLVSFFLGLLALIERKRRKMKLTSS